MQTVVSSVPSDTGFSDRGGSTSHTCHSCTDLGYANKEVNATEVEDDQ